MAITPFSSNQFWDYISTYFSYLDDDSKIMFENFWHGLHISGGSLTDKATRFMYAQAPEAVQTSVSEYYYELEVGPLKSIPLKLDPTDINSYYLIIVLIQFIN